MIKRNLKTYTEGCLAGWDRVRRQVADEFMVRNNIRGIRRGAKIVPFSPKTSPLQVDKRVEPESFTSRLEQPSDLGGQYQSLCADLQKLSRLVYTKFSKIEWLRMRNLRSHELRLTRGKKVDSVLSSKFCSSHVVNLFNEVKKLVVASQVDDASGEAGSGEEEEQLNPSKRPKIEDGAEEDKGVLVTADDLPTQYSERVLENHPDVAQNARVLCFKVKKSHELLDSCLCSKKALADTYLKAGFVFYTQN